MRLVKIITVIKYILLFGTVTLFVLNLHHTDGIRVVFASPIYYGTLLAYVGIVLAGLFVKNKKLFYIIFCLVTIISFAFLHLQRHDFSLSKLPLTKDYPETYCMTMKGIEMLKAGGVFGWDPSHLGGYPTAFTAATFITFPFLPFAFLGDFGYGLMNFLSWILFPYLVGRYAAVIFKDRLTAVYAMFFGALMFFAYYNRSLKWGNIHAYWGALFLLISLICYEYVKQEKKYSLILNVVSLCMLCYSYMFYFFIYCLLVMIDWCLAPSKKQLKRIGFTIGVTVLCSLHYWWYLFCYGEYARHSFIHYEPSDSLIRFPHSFGQAGKWLFNTLGFHKRYCHYYLVPLSLISLKSRRVRPLILGGVVVLGISYLAKTFSVNDMTWRILPQRIYYVLPIILPLVLAHWARRGSHLFPFLLICILAYPICKASFYSFPMGRSAEDYNRALVQKIRSLNDTNMILFENITFNNLLNQKWDRRYKMTWRAEHVYIAQYIAMQTDKKFYSTTHAGWHESVFRGNCINSGIFQGALISDVPISRLEYEFNKWGVRYLVLWNRYSKEYFASYPDKFAPIWNDEKWVIYQYDEAPREPLILQHGEGEILSETYFSKRIKLSDVRGGEEVIVRSNYFPSWRAFYKGQEIPVHNREGLLAFIVPDNGSYSIDLRFPKYFLFHWIALAALALTATVSHKRLI